MSKKIIKRSLALGALMAFVITGSAMAAEKTIGVSNNTTHKNSDAAYKFVESDELLELGSPTYVVASNGIHVTGNKDGEISGSSPAEAIKGNGYVNLHAVDLNITTTKDGNGIYTVYGGQLTLDIDKSLVIKSAGHGINSGAKKNSTITINAENATVNVTAAENAIDSRGNNTKIEITANNVSIESTNTGESDADWKGYAVMTRAEGSGIVIDATGDVDITSARTAVYANKGDISVVGKTIDIVAGEGAGVRAGTSASDAVRGNGNVFLGNADTQSITIEGNMDYGIIARAKNNSGEDGVQSTVVVNGDSLVIGAKADSEIYAGICAASGTESATGYNSSSVTVNTGYTEINADYGIYNMSNGEVAINGDVTINANKSAIITRGHADTIINEYSDEDVTVKITGDIEFNKYYNNATSVTDSNVIINLANADSFLDGKVYVSNASGVSEANKADASNITKMNLGLTNGATWNVTGDSFVNNLTISDANVKVGMNDDGTFTKVNANNYSADNVNVTGNGDVADYIAASSDKEATLEELAKVINGVNTGVVAVSAEEGAVAGAITADYDAATGAVSNVGESVNTVNESIGEAAIVGIAHFRAHMNDMNKRMGELRMANGEAGVWTRMVRGEEEFAGAKSQYNQYQLGYDEKLSVDKRWTVGAAVTFAEGSGNFANGSIENDSTAFAVYGSKLNNDGTFVDLIARYAHFDTDITMNGENADYGANGYSVSAEFGKRIQQGKGLWVEPQVELTYGSVDGAEYTIAGRNVQVGDMDSLIGRVGFSIGKDIEAGNVYARASYLYEFDGETTNTFSAGNNLSRDIKEDLGGGWWEVGVGANINLSKATYIYADIEKTFGGEIDTNWQWNLGVRYSF